MLQGDAIEQVKEGKALGVTVDETLSWSTEIKNIMSKMAASPSAEGVLGW